MQYFKCKCGEHQLWTGLGPTPCMKCEKCGSGFGSGPDNHIEPRPHRLVSSKVRTNDGDAKLSTCIWCMRTKPQLEALGEPFEFAE